jgi:hypothetical protein
MRDPLALVTRYSELLLAVFCVCLVALNVWRLEEWGVDGFRVYLTHAIMQTTLFDFAWVLGILLVFVHKDARALGISYGWIVPTFPFMPTLGLLLYLVMRKRALARAPGNVS